MAMLGQHKWGGSKRTGEKGNPAASFGCPGEFPLERRRFDRLLLSLSGRFRNAAPQDLDDEIEAGLRDVIAYFGGDRITLWEFAEGGKLAVMTHFFAEDGAEPPARSVLHEEMPHLLSRIQQNEIFRMSRVADLPDSASIDREKFQRYGIRSMLSVPMFMADTPRGCLSLASIRSERVWSDETVMQFNRIGTVFGNALDRKVVHGLLEDRISFETLISNLSARFINLPADEVDEAISAALTHVRTFFRADYTVLFEFSTVTNKNRVASASYAPGATTLPEGFDPMEAFPGAYDIIMRQGKPLIRQCPEDFSPESAVDLQTTSGLGVKAAVSIPLDLGSPVMYCISVATLRERTWPEEYIPRVRLLGEIIVEVLKRKRLDVELKRSYEEIVTLKNRLELEADYLRSEIRGGSKHDAIIGQSETLTNVLTQVEQVAPTASTVLICGETGTGKELVAQAVHNLSSRRDRLLVTVNCASLPAALVESELFGREKGAYTGALSRQVGRFELADGSTIFLDEIGELSIELQAKLLRVLQEGRFERLGSPKTIKVDVRVIAATNRNLAEEVKKGTFREDLFYRLNVFPIVVPPLRDRIEDIPLLVWGVINEFSERMGKKINKVAKRDMEALQRYSWPGNIRELRNVIEYAVIVSTDDTLKIRLPENGHSDPAKIMTLEEAESSHIKGVLKLTNWRIKGEGGAAQLLGMNPSTLYSRMVKLGITAR